MKYLEGVFEGRTLKQLEEEHRILDRALNFVKSESSGVKNKRWGFDLDDITARHKRDEPTEKNMVSLSSSICGRVKSLYLEPLGGMMRYPKDDKEICSYLIRKTNLNEFNINIKFGWSKLAYPCRNIPLLKHIFTHKTEVDFGLMIKHEDKWIPAEDYLDLLKSKIWTLKTKYIIVKDKQGGIDVL